MYYNLGKELQVFGGKEREKIYSINFWPCKYKLEKSCNSFDMYNISLFCTCAHEILSLATDIEAMKVLEVGLEKSQHFPTG